MSPTMQAWFTVASLIPLLLVAGMGLCVYGRIAIGHPDAAGQYHGSWLAYAAYLGGPLIAILGPVGLIVWVALR